MQYQPLERVFEYWTSLKKEANIPKRKYFDPSAVGPYLRNIMLVDVIEAPLDFRCRLVGEHIVENSRDVKGALVSALIETSPDIQNIYNVCREIKTLKIPQKGIIDFTTSRGIKKKMSYHGLPLCIDNENEVQIILYVVTFLPFNFK